MHKRTFNRLKNDMGEIKKNFPTFEFQAAENGKNIFIWFITFDGQPNSLYENERYTLKF